MTAYNTSLPAIFHPTNQPTRTGSPVVIRQFKKAKVEHALGDEYIYESQMCRLLSHTDLNMKEFDLYIHGLETLYLLFFFLNELNSDNSFGTLHLLHTLII